MIIIFILGSIISFYALFLHIKFIKEIRDDKEIFRKGLCMLFTSWVSSCICIYALGMSIKLMLGE